MTSTTAPAPRRKACPKCRRRFAYARGGWTKHVARCQDNAHQEQPEESTSPLIGRDPLVVVLLRQIKAELRAIRVSLS